MRTIFLFLFIIVYAVQTIGQSCSGSVGDNIFPDGDFGTGDPNILPIDPQLAPGYRYQFVPPPDDGFYTITNNTTPWGSFAADSWINIGDNSSDPKGYMMVVNASFSPGLFYEKTVTVCGNTNYEFSADVISMNDPSRGSGFISPNISFLINDTIVYSTGDVPVDTRWHTYGFTFTTHPGVTEIKLALRNNAPGGFGNDLALDNISFRPCGPTVVLIDTATFCTPNREILINSEIIGSAFANPVFQWQQSASGNGNWTDISGENNADLNLNNPVDGQFFRLTVASSPANLAQNSCRITSNPARVTYQPERDTIRRNICLGDTIQIANQLFFQTGSTDIAGKAINGCDSVATVIIEVEDLSDFKIEGFPLLCKGDTTVLSAGVFAKYTWSDDTSNSSLDITSPGIYGVTVTSSNGCIGSDTIQINNAEISDFSVELVPPLCANSTDGQLNISNVQGDAPPFLYAINGGPFQEIAQFSNLAKGSYQVAVQNVIGCQLQKELTLRAPLPFTVNLGDPIQLELGDSLTLNAFSTLPIDAFAWEPSETLSCSDCPAPIATPLRNTTYILTALNANGCESKDSINITVLNTKRIFAPNAFSPNGDGVNDEFTLFPGKSVDHILKLDIFDRWGNLIFSSENAGALNWNGNSNGKIAPEGTYVWTASIQFINGIVELFSGDLTLIR